MKYESEWYDKLIKPKIQPPKWVFAPVWTVLYILMAISFILVLLEDFEFVSLIAYLLFAVQLGFNFAWPIAFFKEHDLRKAFLICSLLTLLVLLTMVVFYSISELAGILLLPYFLWCCFATLLNFQILDLNEW